MLDWGCAIEHTPKCIQTIRAISMIPALTGNIDVPGGCVFGMHGLGRFPSLIENLTPEANAKRLGGDRFKMLCGEGTDLPAAHIPTLLQAMREGKPYPVKAFLVFGNNTLTTYATRTADSARPPAKSSSIRPASSKWATRPCPIVRSRRKARSAGRTLRWIIRWC